MTAPTTFRWPGAVTPPVARAGPFVFAGTHTPVDRDAGVLVTSSEHLHGVLASRFRELKRGNLYVDLLRDAIVAQTLVALDNLEASLEAAGSGLGRLVWLRVFVADAVDELFVLQTLGAVLGARLPAGSLVVARNDGSDPAVRVHVDALALTRASSWSIEHVVLPDVAQLTAPFPTATRAGPYVVTSDLPGAAADGSPARTVQDLAREERALVESLGWTPSSQRAFIVQQAAMWGHARRALDALGSGLEHVVHHLAWLRIGMRALGNGSVTRLVSPLVDAYCLTCFPVAGLRDAGSLVEGRYIALDPSQGVSKDVLMPRNGLSNSYYTAIAAGPLVLAAGEVPIDLDDGTLVRTGAALAGRHAIETGLVQRDRHALVEAAYVYRCIGESLAAYGLGYEDIAQQLVYPTDARDWGTILAAHASVTGGAPLPVTSVVPIIGASPFADNRLEIEFFAVRDPTPASEARP